jgi:hypothetical protein
VAVDLTAADRPRGYRQAFFSFTKFCFSLTKFTFSATFFSTTFFSTTFICGHLPSVDCSGPRAGRTGASFWLPAAGLSCLRETI